MAKKKKAKKPAAEAPKPKTSYTVKLDEEQMDRLAERLEYEPSGAWSPYDVAYSLFAFKGENVNVVGYKSGKLVVQGRGTEDFVRDLLEAEITGEPRLGYDEVHHPEWFELHAGCDESGKGDLFGPLVTACVIADGGMVRKWIEAGVMDSKRMSESAILRLDKVIRETEGVIVTKAFARMAKYNELYGKFGNNLNRLLAWYHGKSLNEALDRRPAPWGLLDKFSEAKLVDAYVRKRKSFELRSRTRAESDPVVAAASIVARAVYVREMRRLSEAFGEPLVKGASGKVRDQAKRIVAEKGPEALPEFAKMHFRTAYEALGRTPPGKPAWNFRKGRGKESG